MALKYILLNTGKHKIPKGSITIFPHGNLIFLLRMALTNIKKRLLYFYISKYQYI